MYKMYNDFLKFDPVLASLKLFYLAKHTEKKDHKTSNHLRTLLPLYDF